MGELSRTIHERLSNAYESLRSAHAEGDAYLADIRQAEIDELRRIARNHDIVPKVPDCD